MSLILDALNRSRQDSDPVPGLATQHYSEYDTVAGKRRPYFLWLALLVAVGLIVWLLLERGRVQQVPEAKQAGSAVTEPGGRADAGKTEARAPVAAQKPELPAQLPATVRPGQLTAPGQSQTPAPTVSSTPAVAQPVPEVPAAAARANGEVAGLYQQVESTGSPEQASPQPEVAGEVAPAVAPVFENKPQESPQPVREEQPLDIEKLVLQARDELENARLAEHPAPFLSSLSQQTRDAIPTIYYQGHDYSDTPGKSTVVLNSKALKKGGSPGAGLKVEEILPDSVVLNYRGTQFRLRSLNSWINL